jgi:hypothetical protein
MALGRPVIGLAAGGRKLRRQNVVFGMLRR